MQENSVLVWKNNKHNAKIRKNTAEYLITMMKKNAVSLTLILFPIVSSQDLFLTTSKAIELLPDLTKGGVRSLLHYLDSSGLLSSEKIQKETRYYLTELGERQLIEQFPALNPSWDNYQGEWECIVFQDAPKNDPQFRYLRTQVLKERALQLSRGVYCVPGKFSSEFKSLAQKMYVGSVTLFIVSEWVQGFERNTVTRNFGLGDLATTYSGISKDIDSLLTINQKKTLLTDQQKVSFRSVYDRFRDSLQEDSGLLVFYYPNTVHARILLTQLQQLFLEF